MTKLYLIGAICGIIATVYLFGITRGREKCIQQIATQTTTNIQQQNIKKEKIHAEIYRTGIRDIRDILRAQYTIAD